MNVLIELGVNPNWQDADGVSALHLAAGKADTGILEDILAHRRTDVNIRDRDGATPLHYAARDNRSASIEKLVAAKAEVRCARQQPGNAADVGLQTGRRRCC